MNNSIFHRTFFFLSLFLALAWPTKNAQAACEKPNVFLLLDVSGSMRGSRHNNVRAAIKKFTYNYRAKIRFGLATFSSGYNLRVGISDSAWSTIRNSVDRYRSSGGTMMGTAINRAGSYLRGFASSRPTYLLLITDGYPSRGDRYNPVSEAQKLRTYKVKTYALGINFNASLLGSIARVGGTVRAYNAGSQSDITKAFTIIANIATKEICDNKDNDCDGRTDEDWPQKNKDCYAGSGGCRKKGSYRCKADQTGVECSVRAGTPTTEVCNGRDDNCNGQVDENLTQSCSNRCGNGTKRCQSGRWTACSAPQPKTEKCNNIDDDCDGSIDENWPNRKKRCSVGSSACKRYGLWLCNASGTKLECSAKPGPPSTEVCDGQDNNCDGKIDESLSRSCSTACGSGRETCKAGQWIGCTAKKPQREICDGIDNDCNGKKDDFWPRLGKTCTAGIGACYRKGQYICNTAKTGEICSIQAGKPTKEICDGKDNDCDGNIDESMLKNCSTACGKGSQICSNGRWGTCSAQKPAPEVCDGIDNDCNGKIDETFKNLSRSCSVGVGACRDSGSWVCRADKKGLECSAKKGNPTKEKCDGIDNNCNGKIDENWPKKDKPCKSGSGTCNRQGKYVCKPDGSGIQCSVSGGKPTAEKCDGKDNDCNGKVDDNVTRVCKTKCGSGLETCRSGSWHGCTARQPKPEKCDGLDNSCNGKVDDGLKRGCATVCGNGWEVCSNGVWQACDAKKPSIEICDNKDNDCNKKVDDIKPKKCSGACGRGTAVCQNGKWTGCSGPQPEAEKCDGKDNDCNGMIDDNVPERACSSACGKGVEKCKAGKWYGCTAAIPQPEVCDGRDNDCDGRADDKAICPGGTICKDGACVPYCSSGECRRGLRCKKGVCIGNPCAAIKCKSDRRCIGGKCIKPCSLLRCSSGFICSRGQCVRNDCYLKGCKNGKRCVAGVCESNPCAKKRCAKGQFCRNGNCVSSCAKVKCKKDEKCTDGKCVTDKTKSGPCEKVTCGNGFRCEKGRCVSKPCRSIFCGKGRVCVEGQCKHDECSSIKCAKGEVCKLGQCKKPSGGGGSNPSDGSSNPDGGSSNPDGNTSKPDGGASSKPDGGSSNLENTTGTDGVKADGKNLESSAGNTNKTGGDNDRYKSGGCSCSVQKRGGAAISSLFSLFLILLFGWRRQLRRK